MDTALVIIFNHRYDQNIEKLKNVYKDKFDTIFFLIPFYDGSDTSCISVYESSFYFEGYISQGLNAFFDENHSHYVFIADDLLLNPKINSRNILSELKIDSSSGYIKDLISISDYPYSWLYNHKFLDSIEYQGFDYKTQLPNPSEALNIFKKYQISFTQPSLKSIKFQRSYYNWTLRTLLRLDTFRHLFFLLRKKPVSYPFLAGYSDFFIVPSFAMKKFCHYCRVFSAINLFCEIAIPTSLVLSCPNVVVEPVVKERETKWIGKEFWNLKEVEELERQYDLLLPNLLNSFNDNLLYIHPIKLSKWKI